MLECSLRLAAPRLLAGALVLVAAQAGASVGPIDTGAFPAGSLLVTLDGLADGLEVNGLSTGGLSFGYSLGNGQLVIDGGPGATNNISVPNIVTTGSPGGVLSVLLPGPSMMFGFGYAVLATGTVTDAATITLFDGATNVGTLSYIAVPDPGFPGGFAGIQSTLAFDRVEISFAPSADAWAVDNLRVAAVPEPSALAMLAAGLAVLAWRRRAV